MSSIGTYLRWPERRRRDSGSATAVAGVLPALCYEHGFGELTCGELCRRAEISPEQFHRAYDDLEDAYVSVYKDLAQGFLGEMFAAFDESLSWREQIRAVAYAFQRWLAADHPRAHFTVVEPFHAGERALLVRDAVFAGLFALIDQGRQEMADPEALTPATAESVGGAIFRQIRIAVEERRFAELEGMVPSLMYAVVLPYLGPAVAAEELTLLGPATAAQGSRET